MELKEAESDKDVTPLNKRRLGFARGMITIGPDFFCELEIVPVEKRSEEESAQNENKDKVVVEDKRHLAFASGMFTISKNESAQAENKEAIAPIRRLGFARGMFEIGPAFFDKLEIVAVEKGTKKV